MKSERGKEKEMKVRNTDQGETKVYELHEDGTFNGDTFYSGDIEILSEATRPFMGAPVLAFDDRTYTARYGPNVWK